MRTGGNARPEVVGIPSRKSAYGCPVKRFEKVKLPKRLFDAWWSENLVRETSAPSLTLWRPGCQERCSWYCCTKFRKPGWRHAVCVIPVRPIPENDTLVTPLMSG